MKVAVIGNTAFKGNALTVNLAKELLREQEVTNVMIDEKIKILKLELSNAEKFEKSASEILSQHGFGDPTKKADSLRVELRRLEDQKVSTGVFTLDEIKRVAIRYNLRFLEARQYKGEIPIGLPTKLQEAEQEIKAKIGSKYLSMTTFILAPVEAFELDERPIDPICFIHYRDNTEYDNHKYHLVMKWGNDFSITRLISKWRLRSERKFFLFEFLLTSLLIVLGIKLLFLLQSHLWWWWGYVISSLLTQVIRWTSFSYLNDISANNWQNRYKDR